MIDIQPCDIFFSRGETFIHKAIRFFECTDKNKNVCVDHVGIFVEPPSNLNVAVCIEANFWVVCHSFWKKYYKKQFKVAIFRPLILTDLEKLIVADKAKTYIGFRYGFIKIAAHFLDYFFGGKNVFRSLLKENEYPICSWIVTHAFSEADETFGIDENIATPANIWDFVISNPDKYAYIFELDYLK